MGHSHSHHDHVHPHSPESPDSAGPLIQLGRRQVALLAFAAVAILGPQLLWKRRPLTSAHYAMFLITSVSLSMADAVRRSVLAGIQKFQKLRARVLAHAPRSTKSNNNQTSNLLHYLFRNDNAADRVTLLGVAINILLSAGKLIVGITCHSSALVADAGHSLSDLCSDFVTLGSVQLARLPPDEDHPYGHGKFEAVGSLFLALTLLVTGVGIGTMANTELIAVLKGATVAAPKIPKAPALVAALISIVSKEWLYRITRRVGEDLNSQVVVANAWHHRSDAYSSVLALLSIGLAMFVPGMVFCDSAAGLLVAGMICLTGADILGESINQLTDTAVDDELEKRVQTLAATHGDVVNVTQIRARQVGSKAFMDVRVEIPPAFSSSAIRAVEEQVRQRIITEPYVMDAVVRASSKTSDNVIVCPLLDATTGGHAVPTVSEVENSIRQILLLKHHDVIIKSMTVHYGESNSVLVDVNIQVKDPIVDGDDGPRTTISAVQNVANGVRETIENCQDYIQQASIYLDLNDPSSVRRSAVLT